MSLNPFTLHTPKTLTEAAKLYAELDEVKVLAGGTFLVNNLRFLKKAGIKTPKNIISLHKIEELKGINLTGDTLTIKAMTPIYELLESPLLTDNLHILATIGQNIGTTPIRNMATIGGNLTCRYTWTELGSAMIALDANMHFIGKDGEEESVPAEQFFNNAAKTKKLLSHVSIKKDIAARAGYYRVKKTLHVDIPILSVCIKAALSGNNFTNTRVVINNGVAFPKRDTVLENFLNNKASSEAVTQETINNLDASVYETKNDKYKQHMFQVGIKNAINEIIKK